MKRIFTGFAMCQSMFCAIPFPGNLWDEEARDHMLLFLPLVGLEIGFIWFFGWSAALLLQLPKAVTAVLMTALPYMLTGYIHLDGFMDVTDAVKSCRNLEKRRQILKDPHVGSFAVIGCVMLMLCQFGFFLGLESSAGILILVPAVSRCCSALAIKLLKPMTTSQYAHQQKAGFSVYILIGILAVCVLLGFVFFGLSAAALLGCMVGCGVSIFSGYRNLQGMNGDISGYAITIGEVWAVAVLVLMGGWL